MPLSFSTSPGAKPQPHFGHAGGFPSGRLPGAAGVTPSPRGASPGPAERSGQPWAAGLGLSHGARAALRGHSPTGQHQSRGLAASVPRLTLLPPAARRWVTAPLRHPLPSPDEAEVWRRGGGCRAPGCTRGRDSGAHSRAAVRPNVPASASHPGDVVHDSTLRPKT